MSPKTPVTPRSAARCSRLEIAVSRRVAAGWILWSCAVCAAVWFATALPWAVRGAICLIIMGVNALGIRTCVLLEGSRAVRVIEWLAQDAFTVLPGAASGPHPARLAAGSFRLGGLLVLRLRTPAGMRAVLIDGRAQEIRAFRGLCRSLSRVSRGSSPAVPGVRAGRADTIRPKV